METIQILQVTPIDLVNLISESVKKELIDFSNQSKEKPPIDENEFLTRKETAELFKVSLPTIHDWTNNGILKPYKLGNRTYYKRFELLQTLFNSNRF